VNIGDLHPDTGAYDSTTVRRIYCQQAIFINLDGVNYNSCNNIQ